FFLKTRTVPVLSLFFAANNVQCGTMGSESIIKTAVVGVGHLGQHHARLYSIMDDVELVGVSDTDEKAGRKIAGKCGTQFFSDPDDLIGKVDAVNIATPTVYHHAVAKKFLENGVHVLVEKPITADPAEAEDLVKTADSKNVILQVGHVERFNGAVIAAREYISNPRYIEVIRISPYPKRSLDIGVVMDLMIHDIDIILSFVRSPVLKIDSTAASVLSKKEDIANCRITFENGCVATVTASRISYKAERKIRVFEEDRYVSLDYGKQKFTVYRKKKDDVESLKDIEMKRPRIRKTEPLAEELADFIKCVREGRSPQVSGRHGLNALKLVLRIMDNIKNASLGQ
ncbi:MAG: Gfo/Idh/MocA family oxidoreductase, partial [Elusimicrobiota bacterium]|nr:Gfo/Idh/MocA family oxidoreductase [Elusimicrobiota bacterium]